MKGSRTETQTHRRWWFNHQFLGGIDRELIENIGASDLAMLGCGRFARSVCTPRAPGIPAQNDHAFGFSGFPP